jgi:CBS domain
MAVGRQRARNQRARGRAGPRTDRLVAPLTDREEVTRLISKYNLLAVPVVTATGEVLGIVTVDDVIDAIITEATEDVQKFAGSQAFDEAYVNIGFATMIRKRAGWLCALFSLRNAHRQCHAGVSGGDRKSRRPRPVHSAYHEFGRQLGLAGHLAGDPRPGAA